LNVASRPSSLAAVSETPPGTFFQRALAYVRTHRSRFLRVGLFVALFYAATDLARSTPQDATLALSIAELREEAGGQAGQHADPLEVSILERPSGELLTHSLTRMIDDRDTLRHTVNLAPGEYTVRVELRGATPREGHFEIPADGVVRVSLRAAP